MIEKQLKNCVFCTEIALFSLLLMTSCVRTQQGQIFDVLVIGGGTGGTSAGIQAARLGSNTAIIEATPWLGGMLTAAGVSAIDGNHQMPSGIWGEFRDSLYAHYGGPDKVATGWVSNTQFEPSVGARIFSNITSKIPKLSVLLETQYLDIKKEDDLWVVQATKGDSLFTIKSKLLIDGTDMGDVAAALGVDYDLGMDSRAQTGEMMAPEEANNLIQDLTFAAILQDYGPEADKTIPRPDNYDPSVFYCSCQEKCDDPSVEAHPCETMLTYAKLPNEKYMINWPLFGNDYYAPVVEMNEAERQEVIRKAKEKTLQFVYYIQNELGYKNLGFAEGEFPTADQLPLIPYYREGRRIKGLVQVNVNHLLSPYSHETPLYKTGIAVGDYPIDHHHKEVPDAPEIDFPPVPSFNLPLGALIPKDMEGLIMADKALSVTNIVNGSSRLQPVILQVGQAAGTLAALAIKNGQKLQEVSIREVQQNLVDVDGYLMPFWDVKPDHPQFKPIQRMGAAGLIQGYGEPYLWANRTWFYPDSTISHAELVEGLERTGLQYEQVDQAKEDLVDALLLQALLPSLQSASIDEEGPLSRAQIAAYVDQNTELFEQPVDFLGNLIGQGEQ